MCLIGAGAVILDKLSICDNVIIGAGSVVTRDINDAGTYVGSPAKRVK
jgi:acetyltransferase-like isoleucine patch superfamily enzyme